MSCGRGSRGSTSTGVTTMSNSISENPDQAFPGAKMAIYAPPHLGFPWLMVVFEPRKTTAVSFATEAEARQAMDEKEKATQDRID